MVNDNGHAVAGPKAKPTKALWGFLRPSNIPAALALIVIIVAAAFAENQNRSVHLKGLRGDVLSQASLIRANLEGAVAANVQLVRGFVAALATEPDMGRERFANLAAALMGEGAQLSHLAAAPDMVVTMVHPLRGNESAIGLDYRLVEEQRAAAFRARDTREMVLAGPVNLVQGGKAIVARFPVFIDDGRGNDRFWGIVSAVIDVERVYAAAGLFDQGLELNLAIVGRDGRGSDGALFFGEEEVLANDPVLLDVTLPAGSWQIAAVPVGGWDSTPDGIWRLRLWILFAAALIMVPTVLTGRLMDERQRNISELRRREIERSHLSRRLGLALETSRIGVWELNIETNELYWDDRMNELYGCPQDGGHREYAHWADALHPEDRHEAEACYAHAINTNGRYHSEYRLLLPGGVVRHIRAIGAVYRDDGEPRRIAGVNWDVTADVSLTEELRLANMLMEARNAQIETARKRIEFYALHDSLTGLPNRRYLDDMLVEHIGKFAAGEEQAALLHIDLDRFKQINDTLGHAAGDTVLAHTARVLKSSVEADDFVARVGGDEFVILRRAPTGSRMLQPGALSQLAARVIQEMRQAIPHEGHDCRCGVSIGIASDTDASCDPSRLLVNADIALYRAKAQGRNRFQFFNEALQGEIVRTKRIADEILTGIEKGQFVPWFQPQVCAETLEIVGVEALARWDHPTEGILPPSAFLKIADELNVVGAIDRMIMERTLAQMSIWDRQGLSVPKASVNVSARRLNDEALVEGIRRLRVEPGRLSFELVESIFLDEHDDLLSWNVESIKELGIDIEIDDFGTGYASIVSLLKLKPRRLKIDRQFIMPILRSPAERQLVGSIVEIGKSLGIEVLAEGVETMEHARILRRLGCQALQGYAFARPMSGEDFTDFARERMRAKAS